MNLATALQPVFQNRAAPAATGVPFSQLFGRVTTKKGNLVDQKSTLTLSAFFNGVEIITNDFAKLPKAIYRKTDKGREKQTSHPVNYLLSTKPNQYMTAFMFDKTMILNAIFKGNGYAEIIRNQTTGAPISFELIDQDKHFVQVLMHNGKLFYKFANKIVESENMLHIPGFSTNGITGISVITYAANSIGIDLSAKEFATDYYNEKGIGYGVVTSSTAMKPDAKNRLGEALASVFSNSENFKVPIIDEASKFQHIKITPQESQFLLTHKNGVEECARWLNIQLHKLKVLDNVNNSITENLEIQHVSDSILPWAMKFEQEYSIKLLSQAEIKNNFYVKSNTNALLRADTATRGEYYTKMVNSKLMSPNEVRVLEDLNLIEGGDELLQPVNLQTQTQINAKMKSERQNPGQKDVKTINERRRELGLEDIEGGDAIYMSTSVIPAIELEG